MGMVGKTVDIVFSHTGVFDRFRDWLQHGFIMEKTAIKQALNVKKRTLDFGCGIGQYSVLFDVEQYVGVDIDKQLLAYAGQKYQKRFSLYTQRFAAAHRNQFVQVIASYVFHHISDTDAGHILEELATMLKKKGKLMVIEMCPARQQRNWVAKLLILLDRGRHVRSQESLVSLFKKYFTLVHARSMRAGPYLDYVAVFEKR